MPIASSNLSGRHTFGIIPRPHCFAASTETLFQRAAFSAAAAAFAIFVTHRSVITGTISYTPSSTAFWITVSIFPALGKAWKSVTFILGSESDSRFSVISAAQRFFEISVSRAVYSKPLPSKTISSSPTDIRSAFSMCRASSKIYAVLPAIFCGSVKNLRIVRFPFFTKKP